MTNTAYFLVKDSLTALFFFFAPPVLMFVVGGVLLTQACLLKCPAVDRDLTLMSLTHLLLIYLFILEQLMRDPLAPQMSENACI